MVTSSWQAKIHHVIANHEIDVFDHIICRTDVRHGKSNPEGYLKALEIFDVNPQEVLVFEDSIGGIKAAQDANIDCISVNQPNYAHIPNITDYRQLSIDKGKISYPLVNDHFLSINETIIR